MIQQTCRLRRPNKLQKSGVMELQSKSRIRIGDCPGIYARPDGIVYTSNVKGVSDPETGVHCAKAIGSPSTGSQNVSKTCGNGKQATGCCPAAPDGCIRNPGVTGDTLNTLPSSETSRYLPTYDSEEPNPSEPESCSPRSDERTAPVTTDEPATAAGG